MKHVAFSKRNYLQIQIRTFYDFIIRRIVIRVINDILKSKKGNNVVRLLVFPSVRNLKNAQELFNRINWSIPYKRNIFVDILVSEKVYNNIILDINNSKEKNSYYYKNPNIKFILYDKIDKKIYSKIVIYNSKKFFLALFKFGIKYYEILDKNHFLSVEGKNQRDLLFNCLKIDEKDLILNKSIEIFEKLKKNYTKCYCFTTGPSFDMYKNFNFENGSLKIICNSIIKNEKFLDYISGAQILTFGDPVFHFGPSTYANLFREKMVASVIKYDTKIVVPFSTVKLLLLHYPVLKNHIIGIPDKTVKFTNPIWGKFAKNVEFNFPSKHKFWVKPSGNILTWYMIPFASSLTNQIYILGADGRKTQGNYWWKHNSSVQFNNEMETVFDAHPSFFRDRLYSDYYEKHCVYLESLLQFGEKKGKKYFSLTPSYIPALKNRYFKNA